jgi:hypothetical protein
MLRQLRRLAWVWLLALLTASCGGGGDGDVANSGGIGGTGISSGSISSFGSIFVNGIEFDLTGVPITIDDQAGTEADLQLGQVVTVTTNIGDDGSVSVTKVNFDYNLEGPISDVPQQADPDGLTKSFTVLGTTVIVDIDDTVFGTGYAFDQISQNDFVQISGFFDSNNVLHAKYITKTDSPGLDVEAKGKITDLDTLNQTFMLRGLTVTYAGADLSGVPGGLQDGLFVEVKGTLVAPGSVSASTIELEGPAQNAVAAAVEGIITSFSSNGDFVIDSGNGPVHVDAAAAAFEPPGLVLRNDLEIEAEGSLVNGTLVATKVELRSTSIKLEAKVATQPMSNTIELDFGPSVGQKMVTVDGETRYQDQRDHLRTFGISDINAGDFLRVKARQGDDELVATRVQRTDPRDVVLQGPVEAFTPTGPNTGTITILELNFDTIAGTTEFKNVDNQPLVGDFYTQVSLGDLLHIKDKDSSSSPPNDGMGNGTADTVEFEN